MCDFMVQHDPITNIIKAVVINVAQNVAAIRIQATTMNPNGVFQLNGNLNIYARIHTESKYFLSFKTFKVHCQGNSVVRLTYYS